MYDVVVNIDLTKPVGKLGIGIPLILEEQSGDNVEYTECSNLADVVSAGFSATSNVYKAAQLLFAQDNAPKKIAVATAMYQTAEEVVTHLASYDWRQLIVVREAEAEDKPDVAKISAAVEALEGKMYFAGLEALDTTKFTTTNLRRTVLFYCDPTADTPAPEAALVGETAGRAAGSFTYKNLKLKGIVAQELCEADVENIHKNGGITFINKAGDAVTSEGKVAGGEYIDVVDSEDYIVQQLAYKTQKMLNSAAKIPYDNNGIAMLESVAVDVLNAAYNDGMIATKADGTPDYSVTYALREDTSESDRADRKYFGGYFAFALAGAVHHVEITGSITA